MNANRIFGGIIILAFVATMVVLVRRETGADMPALDGSEGTLFGGVTTAAKWRDIDEWMLIQHHDAESGRSSTVGAAHTSIVQLDHPTTSAAYRAEFSMEAKLSALLPRIHVKGAAVLDRDTNLSKFIAKADGVGMTLTAQGEIHREMLFLKISKPSNNSYSRRALAEPVSLSEALRPSLNRHMEIKPGAKMSSPVIDPLTGQVRGKLTVRIEKAEIIDIGGQPTRAFRVKTSVGDIDTLMWVDEEGHTLRRNLLSGLFMEKTTKDKALETAPSLDQEVDIPPLELKDFEGVPVQKINAPGDSDDGNNRSGNSFLNAILG